MITTRYMASAYILNNDDILLLKHAQHKKMHPGRWCNVGGHIDPPEMKSPLHAMLREIMEETGIRADQLNDLELKYIILAIMENEFRQQFIWFPRSVTRTLSVCDEGELRWIARKDLYKYEMPFSGAAVLEHFLKRNFDDRQLYTGTITGNKNNPMIVWTTLNDYERRDHYLSL